MTSRRDRCHASASGRKRAPSAAAPEQPAPALPAWKAFVVQFRRDATGRQEAFSGRVEHLSSGQRAYFGSPEELLAILDRMLGELGELGENED